MQGRKFYSLFMLKCDDGRFESEIDGPHDERIRNARAMTWLNKEAQEDDLMFKMKLGKDNKIIIERFEDADIPAIMRDQKWSTHTKK